MTLGFSTFFFLRHVPNSVQDETLTPSRKVVGEKLSRAFGSFMGLGREKLEYRTSKYPRLFKLGSLKGYVIKIQE